MSRFASTTLGPGLVMRLGLVLALAGPWLSLPAVGFAEPGIVAAVPGATPSQAILVGPSGEIYQPQDQIADTWRRDAAGGVAVDVRAVMRPEPGHFVVAGDRSPLYRSTDGTWHVLPLRERGRVHLAPGGGATALAIGFHVHVYTDKGSWRRIARARGRPSALWASSADRVYVATRDGAIYRWATRGWSRIRHSLAADDRIVRLVGHPGKSLYGLATSGTIVNIGARVASSLERSDELATLEPHALSAVPDGGLLVAGTLERTLEPEVPEDGAERATPASRRLVLARREKERLVPMTLSRPVTIPARDRVTVLLTDAAGHGLLATRRGVVVLWDAAGRVRDGTLVSDLPEARAHRSSAQPARTAN